MKKIVVLVMAVFMVTVFSGAAMAGFDKCLGCHNGKTAPDKAKLTAKFKSANALVKGAKESKNPMMNAIKGDESAIRAAAKDLGLK